jgi:hypothetical protein
MTSRPVHNDSRRAAGFTESVSWRKSRRSAAGAGGACVEMTHAELRPDGSVAVQLVNRPPYILVPPRSGHAAEQRFAKPPTVSAEPWIRGSLDEDADSQDIVPQQASPIETGSAVRLENVRGLLGFDGTLTREPPVEAIGQKSAQVLDDVAAVETPSGSASLDPESDQDAGGTASLAQALVHNHIAPEQVPTVAADPEHGDRQVGILVPHVAGALWEELRAAVPGVSRSHRWVDPVSLVVDDQESAAPRLQIEPVVDGDGRAVLDKWGNPLLRLVVDDQGSVVPQLETEPVVDGDGRAVLDKWGDPVLRPTKEVMLDRFGRPEPERIVVSAGFEVRRVEFGGEVVADLTVRVEPDGESMDDQRLAGMWGKVLEGVDRYLNAPSYRLRNGDLVHVTVERQNFDDVTERPHVRLTRAGSVEEMNSHTWAEDADPLDYAHEIAHALGMRDEYTDLGAEQRPDVAGSLMGNYTLPVSEADVPDKWRAEFRANRPIEQGLRSRHLDLLGALIGDVPVGVEADVPRSTETAAGVVSGRAGSLRGASAGGRVVGTAPKAPSRKKLPASSNFSIDEMVGISHAPTSKAYGGGQKGRAGDRTRLRFARDKRNVQSGQTLTHLSLMLHDTIRALRDRAVGDIPRDREVQGMLINNRLVFASNFDVSVDLLESVRLDGNRPTPLRQLLETRQTPDQRRDRNMGPVDFGEYNERMNRAAAKVDAAFDGFRSNGTATAMRLGGGIRFEKIENNGPRLRDLLTKQKYQGAVIMLRYGGRETRSMHAEQKLLLAMKAANVSAEDVSGPLVVMGKYRPCMACYVALSWHAGRYDNFHFNHNFGSYYQDSVNTLEQYMPEINAGQRAQQLLNDPNSLMSAAELSRRNPPPNAVFNDGFETIIPTEEAPERGYVTASDTENEQQVDHHGRRTYLSRKRDFDFASRETGRSMGAGQAEVSRRVNRVLSEDERVALRIAWYRADYEQLKALLLFQQDRANKTELAEALGITWANLANTYKKIDSNQFGMVKRKPSHVPFDPGAEGIINSAMSSGFRRNWALIERQSARSRDTLRPSDMPESLVRQLLVIRREHSVQSIAAYLEMRPEELRRYLDSVEGSASGYDADVKMEDVGSSQYMPADETPQTYFDQNTGMTHRIPPDTSHFPRDYTASSSGAGPSRSSGAGPSRSSEAGPSSGHRPWSDYPSQQGSSDLPKMEEDDSPSNYNAAASYYAPPATSSSTGWHPNPALNTPRPPSSVGWHPNPALNIPRPPSSADWHQNPALNTPQQPSNVGWSSRPPVPISVPTNAPRSAAGIGRGGGMGRGQYGGDPFMRPPRGTRGPGNTRGGGAYPKSPRSVVRRAPRRASDLVDVAEIEALREGVAPRPVRGEVSDLLEVSTDERGVPQLVIGPSGRAGLDAAALRAAGDRVRPTAGLDVSKIAFDHRILEASNGRRVQDYSLVLHLDAKGPEAVAQRAGKEAALLEELDNIANRGFLRGGDQVHFSLQFTDDPAAAHHTVDLSGDPKDITTPTSWSVHTPTQVLLHEVFHLYGIRDEHVEPPTRIGEGPATRPANLRSGASNAVHVDDSVTAHPAESTDALPGNQIHRRHVDTVTGMAHPDTSTRLGEHAPDVQGLPSSINLDRAPAQDVTAPRFSGAPAGVGWAHARLAQSWGLGFDPHPGTAYDALLAAGGGSIPVGDHVLQDPDALRQELGEHLGAVEPAAEDWSAAAEHLGASVLILHGDGTMSAHGQGPVLVISESAPADAARRWVGLPTVAEGPALSGLSAAQVHWAASAGRRFVGPSGGFLDALAAAGRASDVPELDYAPQVLRDRLVSRLGSGLPDGDWDAIFEQAGIPGPHDDFTRQQLIADVRLGGGDPVRLLPVVAGLHFGVGVQVVRGDGGEQIHGAADAQRSVTLVPAAGPNEHSWFTVGEVRPPLTAGAGTRPADVAGGLGWADPHVPVTEAVDHVGPEPSDAQADWAFDHGRQFVEIPPGPDARFDAILRAVGGGFTVRGEYVDDPARLRELIADEVGPALDQDLGLALVVHTIYAAHTGSGDALIDGGRARDEIVEAIRDPEYRPGLADELVPYFANRLGLGVRTVDPSGVVGRYGSGRPVYVTWTLDEGGQRRWAAAPSDASKHALGSPLRAPNRSDPALFLLTRAIEARKDALRSVGTGEVGFDPVIGLLHDAQIRWLEHGPAPRPSVGGPVAESWLPENLRATATRLVESVPASIGDRGHAADVALGSGLHAGMAVELFNGLFPQGIGHESGTAEDTRGGLPADHWVMAALPDLVDGLAEGGAALFLGGDRTVVVLDTPEGQRLVEFRTDGAGGPVAARVVDPTTELAHPGEGLALVVDGDGHPLSAEQLYDTHGQDFDQAVGWSFGAGVRPADVESGAPVGVSEPQAAWARRRGAGFVPAESGLNAKFDAVIKAAGGVLSGHGVDVTDPTRLRQALAAHVRELTSAPNTLRDFPSIHAAFVSEGVDRVIEEFFDQDSGGANAHAVAQQLDQHIDSGKAAAYVAQAVAEPNHWEQVAQSIALDLVAHWSGHGILSVDPYGRVRLHGDPAAPRLAVGRLGPDSSDWFALTPEHDDARPFADAPFDTVTSLASPIPRIETGKDSFYHAVLDASGGAIQIDRDTLVSTPADLKARLTTLLLDRPDVLGAAARKSIERKAGIGAHAGVDELTGALADPESHEGEVVASHLIGGYLGARLKVVEPDGSEHTYGTGRPLEIKSVTDENGESRWTAPLALKSRNPDLDPRHDEDSAASVESERVGQAQWAPDSFDLKAPEEVQDEDPWRSATFCVEMEIDGEMQKACVNVAVLTLDAALAAQLGVATP